MRFVTNAYIKTPTKATRETEVNIIKNAVLDATEAYVDARLAASDFVKTQIGVVQSYITKGGKYYHTVKCDNNRVTYTNVLSIGNVPFPARSVVFLIAPNAQYSNQFILGKLDNTPVHITAGSIDIGNGKFKVDSSGNMTATNGTFRGRIESSYITSSEIRIGNNFRVDVNGNLTASSGTFSGTLSAARGTMSDGTGTLSISNGNLYISNWLSGGAGVFAERLGSQYYSCWGAVNSGARDYGMYLEVPTLDIIRAGSNASDKRLKKYIKDIDDKFSESLIYNINPKQFKYKQTEHYKDNGELHFGVIAQEILDIEKEYKIDENNRLCYLREMDNMYAVDYKQLIAPIIKVIQNQKKQIDNQQFQINKLKLEIAELKKEDK